MRWFDVDMGIAYPEASDPVLERAKTAFLGPKPSLVVFDEVAELEGWAAPPSELEWMS